MEIFLAVTLGLAFGFALNRAGATNPENIINMLRLTDLRLMKAILFAIGLSSILLFSGLGLGVIDAGHVSVKATYLGVIIGGAMLGVGFAIAGYCPGTGLAALVTGRKDAAFFVLGGLVGAFIYTLLHGFIAENTSWLKDIAGGKSTLANTGVESYPALIDMNGTFLGIVLGAAFVAIAFALPMRLLGKKEDI
jgi:hypothetical protein